ncbi:Uncharacterized protein M6B38_240825 [Iris pallida]|uniref:Uncharacterized protein n=1 Tax=Iris pallida TaxID=29817 RepID=A0AAX6DIW8_IRIPA|nr:Uncharacterized protein M6B38_240825 [Iris pallida]
MLESMPAALCRNPLAFLRPQRIYSLPLSRNGVNVYRVPNPQPLHNELRFVPVQRNPCRWRIRVFPSDEAIDGSQQREVLGEVSLDAFLSFAEMVFIAPPIIYSIGCAAGMLIPGVIKPFHLNLGSKAFVWQFIFLVCAVVIGALIRRRQWGRICRETKNGVGVDLLARIEKLEEDLKSSATIVRVLSRQLEKLGIRFRVTRNALKEPISEAAVLAQKNSEATRALAVQEDILEKELGEVQKVLLAMQEQQQKQLELILAIGKAGRVLEARRNGSAEIDQHKNGTNSVPERRVNSWNPKQQDSADPIPREPTI